MAADPLTTELPPELRLKILANTSLVPRDSINGTKIGLHIDSGVITYPRHHYISWHEKGCSCPEPPRGFFGIGHTLREEATETMLSQNRLVFSGPPQKSLEFLQNQGNLVKHIREIDFQFMPEDIETWSKDEGSGSLDHQWHQLVGFLESNLALSKLTLSLDAGPGFIIYQEQVMTEADMGYVLEAYKKIVTPLKGFGDRGLKEFNAYFAAFHGYETEAEKEVMGGNYVTKSKIPATERNPIYPHGCPRPELEWEEGMELA